ncbi:MAG: HD domain-containing protein [Bacteroidales bacterium]
MDILDEARKYVTKLFKENNDDKLRYHNIRHTRNVVDAARLIAGKCMVNDRDMEMLLVSAWFHDVGYLERKVNHEDISKKYAREFLERHSMQPEYISQVERCIEATRVPQNPQDKLSSILCDADLFHVSQETLWRIPRYSGTNCRP